MRGKVCGAVLALSLMSGPVLAGGMAEPIMEQEPVIEAAAASNAAIIVPLMLLLLIAAAASSGGGAGGPA
ncbi:MAG: hypothetical protein KDD95_09985 [Rhodobacteraceae bacterium]|nr:hypothetical protein [Paracoccaceae bacterium]MCC0046547.1 hypothetical protein [Defluviimonas sp.]MCP5376233.1 hypothetical protein [Paracoccaceae bacterium]